VQSEGEVISHKIVSSQHVKLEIKLGSNCFQNMEGYYWFEIQLYGSI